MFYGTLSDLRVAPATFLFGKEKAGGSSESDVVAEELTVFAVVFGRTHPLGPPLFAKARGRREEVDCFNVVRVVCERQKK